MKLFKKRLDFWEHKSLFEMTPEEWEMICDGCGRCCLYKLEDAETGHILYTSVACELLDIYNCRCRDYRNRKEAKDICIVLTPANIKDHRHLPKTCAYRRLLEGKGLPNWHPLVSGDPKSVHAAGVSLRRRAISETEVDLSEIERYIIDLDF